MTRGRNSRASTMTSGRQYAVSVEGTTILFECGRANHTYKINFAKKPIARRMGAAACRMMASWWTRAKGGCLGECPKCKRSDAKVHALPKREPL